MEKYKLLINLGIKYLKRYKKRYAFLFAALVFCFAIVTFITSSKDSMYKNVYYSAQSHYAGDIIAVGQNRNYNFTFLLDKEQITNIIDSANESEINPSHIIKRTYFNNDGIVYFNGMSIIQKYIIGCDWEGEDHLFSKMDFSSSNNNSLKDNSIIISEPVSHKLNAKIGDIITLEVHNLWGQKNTGQFEVCGIVKDYSIFGYFKVYISRLSLNRLMLINDDECSAIGFFFKKPSDAEVKRQNLQRSLAQRIDTGALVYNREEREKELSKQWEGSKIFLYTLPVYLSEIASLMEAMDILTYLLYGMMLIIIFVSASVTYRLILHERTREIGVMRSIGFYSEDLKLVLWTEITILGIFSIVSGFLLSVIFSIAASFISFSWFPSFEIFLKNGRLTALFLPETVVLNIILTLVILILTVVFPAQRASNKNLPSLLSGEAL